MKNLIVILVLCLGLFLVAGCATSDSCCGSCQEGKACSCEKCPVSGECGDCPKAGEATSCVCPELKSGGTGWCADCKVGYCDGKKVACKGECAANPGGPPCKACVK